MDATQPSGARPALAIVAGMVGTAFALAGIGLSLRGTDPYPAWVDVPVQGVGLAVLWVGVLVWTRQPDSWRMGQLLVAVGATWYLADLQYSSDPVLFRLGFWLFHLSTAVLTHVLVSFPDGRLVRRPERLVVATGYVLVLVTQGMRVLTERPIEAQFWGEPRDGWHSLRVDSWSSLGSIAALGVAGLVIVLVVQRWKAEPPTMRRSLGLVWTSVVMIAMVVVLGSVASQVAPTRVKGVLLMVYSLAVLLLGVAVLTGLLRTQLSTHQRVTRLLERLHDRPADTIALRRVLADALDDPDLDLLFQRTGSDDYVDVEGLPAPVPAGADREATMVRGAGGQPLAVLVHNPVLLREPQFHGRLRAVVAAASLAIENARLHADSRAHLRGLLEVEHSTRRGIRLALHDGPQNRLSALQLLLGQVRDSRHDVTVDDGLQRIADELQATVRDLREVTEGVYPSNLRMAGLAGALDPLAQRSPIPLVLDVDPGRWPADVEETAFYVVSEAVGNAHKHAHARGITVNVRSEAGKLVVEVVDDGVGGAALTPIGSGLRGLRDRVLAKEGRLTITSNPNGTTIRAALPCA